VPGNPKLILCVIWETPVLVGQLLALQEGSAVGWMTMESLINFCQEKCFSCLQIIQTTSKVIPTLPPIAQGKAARSGSQPLFSI
jgi:hypothetical protein